MKVVVVSDRFNVLESVSYFLPLRAERSQSSLLFPSPLYLPPDAVVKSDLIFIGAARGDNHRDEKNWIFVYVDEFGSLGPGSVKLDELDVLLTDQETTNEPAIGLVGEYLPTVRSQRACAWSSDAKNLPSVHSELVYVGARTNLPV